jgi:hypothetical protein
MGIGKKFALAMGLAAMAATAIAPAAIAGVVSSNHDMIFKYTLAGAARRAGTCSFCHIPHKAGGDKLWASTYAAPGAGWRSEIISQLCYTCHGTGSGYLGALELNPFGSTGKHGRTVATLTGYGDIASLPATVEVSAGDSNLKCTSCHDVHNNDSRPFLRYTGGAFNFQGHCQTCHAFRDNTIGQETGNVVPNAAAVNFSQHPTDQLPASSNDNGESGVGDEAFVAINGAFNIVPGVQAPGTGGWNLGGHRNDGTATGNMTCATCHAVHGNETAIYSDTGDGAGEVAGEVNGLAHLEVLNPDPTTVSAAICTGCHANVMVAGVGAGPGTVGSSHPINTVRGTWSVTGITGPGAPAGSKWGNNGGDVIVCQSCHDMHYGAPNTSLLRGPIDTPVATSNTNCNACHSTSTMPNHHPAGVAMYAGVDPSARSTAYNWSTFAFGTAVASATNDYAFAAGNVVTCGTCHGGNSQAHNNTSGFPSLTSLNTVSDMCVECHSTNPSQYTATAGIATQAAGITQASHYVGDIQTVGYKRVAVWNTTGLASKYGAVTANGEVICESCHTLKLNTGTLPGPTTSNNTVVGTAVRNVSLLLERNGNLNTVYNAGITGTNADMCTGCHGSSPTGGTSGSGTSTHPTISMGMSTAATAPIQAKIVAGTVSLTAGNLVNCESCHRPHDAAAGSGALILEAAGTASTKIAGGVTAGTNGGVFDRATGNSGANYTEEATFCNYCHTY